MSNQETVISLESYAAVIAGRQRAQSNRLRRGPPYESRPWEHAGSALGSRRFAAFFNRAVRRAHARSRAQPRRHPGDAPPLSTHDSPEVLVDATWKARFAENPPTRTAFAAAYAAYHAWSRHKINM